MKRIFHVAFYVVVALIAMVLVAMSLMTFRVIPYEVRIVTTGSMSPTITPYSAILIRKGQYEVGQPISFETPNGVVTHRLVSVNTDGSLATKGDAVSTIDPSFEPVSKVIGGVKLIIRGALFWALALVALAGLFYSFYRLADASKTKTDN